MSRFILISQVAFNCIYNFAASAIANGNIYFDTIFSK